MRSIRRTGFTLIELMIATLIAVIGIAAVLSFFLVISRSSQEQQQTADLQQNVRMAAEFLSRDIRSAGFVIGGMNGFQVEQNCGDNPSTTGAADACPNGSDRVIIRYQLPNTRMFACDPNTCPSNAGDHIVIHEPNALCPGGPGSCGPPYTVFQNLYCGMPGGSVITLCDKQDVNCITAVVKSVKCDVGCGGGLGNTCVQIQFTSPGPSALDPVRNGAPDTDLVIAYQLLDVDGDGSTELVRSTSFVDNGGANSTIYQVVAPNIDDFQVGTNETVDANDFRASACKGTGCFDWNRDIYTGGNFDGGVADAVYANGHGYATSIATIRSSCADGNVVCAGGNCAEVSNNGPTVHWGCSEHVRGVMFELAARTRKIMLGGGTGKGLIDVGYHPAIGNNAQAATAFVSNPTLPVAGCPATTFDGYLTCSLNGNRQGFRWRVVGDQMLMRNLAGLY